MKRWALRIFVLLLLGAIVNVAVAWGCASWSPLRLAGSIVVPVEWTSDAVWIDADEHRGFGLMRLELLGYYTRLPESLTVQSLPSWSRLGDQAIIKSGSEDRVVTREEEIVAGWPCGALRGFRNTFPYVAQGMGFVKAGWARPGSSRVLPFWPSMPGFVINTVFYAVVLWVLLAGPAALRRERRIRRGRCPKCAYPIGASDVCTECGTLLVSISR